MAYFCLFLPISERLLLIVWGGLIKGADGVKFIPRLSLFGYLVYRALTNMCKG